jgi:hypothetical protein
LSEKCDGGSFVFLQAAGDAEMLDVGAGEGGGFFPPIVRREVEVFRADEVADAAALVGFGDAGPEAIEFRLELFGLVEKNGGAGMRSKMVLSAPATGE